MALLIGRSRLPELMGTMPQRELARRLEVTDGFISEVISGKKKFSLELARNAADILGVSIEELYEWKHVRTRKRQRQE